MLQPLPDLADLLSGYDLVIDAHTMSVGEVARPETRRHLPLSETDAYFSSGFWITRSVRLLEQWDRLVESVVGRGNLWENDAFVAAVYSSGAKIRPVCGNIWHVRGTTSVQSVEVRDHTVFHGGYPALVLHANWFFTVRADGRRVFDRPELAAVQDFYENMYHGLMREGWRR
jgi:hypothetical protein